MNYITLFFNSSKKFKIYLTKCLISPPLSQDEPPQLEEYDKYIIKEILEKLKDIDELFDLLTNNDTFTKKKYIKDSKIQTDLIIRFYMIRMMFQDKFPISDQEIV
jgi:hypothetical protein